MFKILIRRGGIIKKIILYGGGDFAVELATYIVDINAALSLASSNAHGSDLKLTDVISSEPAREQDLTDIIGYSPVFHDHINSISDLEEKYFILSMGNASVRHKIHSRLSEIGAQFLTLVHPLAYVARTSTVGAGSVICPFVFVGPFARVSENCVLNINCSVGHDVEIGTSSVLSPGAMINGHGTTGSAAFLGAGAIMNPNAKLGTLGQLSAGSVLTKSAGDGFLMHGNPAVGRQMVKVN